MATTKTIPEHDATTRHGAAVRGRRGALGLLAAAMAGAMAGRVVAPDSALAAAGQPLRLGHVNDAGTAPTSLVAGTRAAALSVVNRSEGGFAGLQVSSNGAEGFGVRALANGPAAIAVYGLAAAANGTGLRGVSAPSNGTGVRGEGFSGVIGTTSSPAGTGVLGTAPPGGAAVTGRITGLGSGVGVTGEGPTGVRGEGSPDGIGVVGSGGTGVRGVSPGQLQGIGVRGEGGTGVFAVGTGVGLHTIGLEAAIEVDGISRFDTVGESGFNRGYGLIPAIPSGAQTLLVRDRRVTTKSFVLVMLASRPQKFSQTVVSWIERRAGRFTIHLNQPTDGETRVVYFVIEPLDS